MTRKNILAMCSNSGAKSHCMLKTWKWDYIFLLEAPSNSCVVRLEKSMKFTRLLSLCNFLTLSMNHALFVMCITSERATKVLHKLNESIFIWKSEHRQAAVQCSVCYQCLRAGGKQRGKNLIISRYLVFKIKGNLRNHVTVCVMWWWGTWLNRAYVNSVSPLVGHSTNIHREAQAK